jgi:hypothetical protein
MLLQLLSRNLLLPLLPPLLLLLLLLPLTSTLSLKACAWSKAACPMEPSITKITRSGATASATCSQAPPPAAQQQQ